ncbi:MAG TPA: VCBS repeat-containing protein, partial [Caldithrix sp.]|nr:VCBS repeat-containing protein [Caldithrix sp.]
MKFGQMRMQFPGYINDIIVADFNGDGYDDIAVIDYKDDIRVFKGNKNLKFKQVFKRNFAEAGSDFAPPADYNNDGKLDIVTTNSSDNKYISVFLGKGNGKFKRKPRSVPVREDYNEFDPIRIRYMQNFNFDGDKRTDIIAFRDKGDFMVFRNRGRGKFNVSIHQTGRVFCYAMTAADYTGDNLDDCFVYHFNSGDICFYHNNGDKTFTRAYRMERDDAICNLYTADLNNDGKPDYISDGYWVFSGFQSDWARAHTMLGKGNGTLIKKKNFPDEGRLTYGATFNDFNGDNKLDIAAAQYSGINVYPGRGTGKFKKPTILGNGLHITPKGNVVWKNNIASGDFNGDGKVDIIGAQFFRVNTSYDSNIMVFLNGGKASSLKISDLLIETLQYNITSNTILFKGSFNYSGNNIELRYDQNLQSPMDSAFMEFKVDFETSSDSKTEYSAVY